MGLHKRYANVLDHETSNKRNAKIDCNTARYGATKVLRETRRGNLRFFWLVAMAAVGCLVVIVSLYKYGLRVHRCHVNRQKGPENADGFQFARPEYQSGFQLVKTLKRPVDMCALKLGFRQIALLYLLKGSVIHEDMWRNWFEASTGKIPILQQGQVCRGKKYVANMNSNDLKRFCHVEDQQVSNRELTVIEKQHLYDVWVHVPRYVDANIVDSSIFAPYVLPKSFRVDANWGSHSLIDATRVLYAAALTNPLNSKFVLISEADVPLYSSLFVYRQLVSEEKSRINACNVTVSKDWSWNPNEGYRLRPDMLEAGMSQELWRKSWQWTSLLRKHARSVVQDRDVDDLFRTYCRPRWDESWCDFRVCYSDEHYIPTLFSSLGLDNETDCVGELTDRDWSRVKSTDAHPYAYQPSEIDTKLLLALRHPEREGCHAVLDNLLVDKCFVTAEDLSDIDPSTLCKSSRMNEKELLGPLCPLLARKFLENTVDAVLKAAMPLHAASGHTSQ